MPNAKFPIAVVALEAAPRTKPSNYPEPFFSRMAVMDLPIHFVTTYQLF